MEIAMTDERSMALLGPSAQRIAGTDNPQLARWTCTAVSKAAVAGSGMILATRRPSSPGGALASSTT
jgi:hypothetical protein